MSMKELSRSSTRTTSNEKTWKNWSQANIRDRLLITTLNNELLHCEQSFFCSKIRGEECKEERNTNEGFAYHIRDFPRCSVILSVQERLFVVRWITGAENWIRADYIHSATRLKASLSLLLSCIPLQACTLPVGSLRFRDVHAMARAGETRESIKRAYFIRSQSFIFKRFPWVCRLLNLFNYH